MQDNYKIKKMFSFFKKNKTLRELIPSDYIDIHSHLLPGIDDGSKNFDNSLALLRSLQEIGFSQFITTPHIIKNVWDNNTEIIEKTKNETLSSLEKLGFSAPLNAAAEYLMDDSFVKLFKSEPLLTLKDKYVLVEMSYMNAPIQLYDILFELQVAGYKPVLAHPERYLYYHKNFNEYEKLKKSGCLFQLNLLATMGYYGNEVTRITEELLKKGMYNFVGSDVHHRSHIQAFDQKIKVNSIPALKEVIKNNEIFKF